MAENEGQFARVKRVQPPGARGRVVMIKKIQIRRHSGVVDIAHHALRGPAENAVPDRRQHAFPDIAARIQMQKGGREIRIAPAYLGFINCAGGR